MAGVFLRWRSQSISQNPHHAKAPGWYHTAFRHFVELLPVEHGDEKLAFSVKGLVTNANYSMKKAIFLLFINHRLVESTALKKALDTVYAAYLPKGTHPFLYLSLEISPQNVDVNVHPTKHEVHFLHEDAIIEVIQKAVETKLLGSNVSRTYFTQALLPGTTLTVPEVPPDKKQSVGTSNDEKEKLYAHQMVRTDSKTQKLDSFLTAPATPSGSHQQSKPSTSTDTTASGDPQPSTSTDNSSSSTTETPSVNQAKQTGTGGGEAAQSTRKRKNTGSVGETPATEAKRSLESPVTERREVRLSSVLSLRAEVRDNAHAGLRDLLHDHTFVGCVTPEHTLIQHQTKLYLANTTKLCRHLFYQLMLHDFSNAGMLRLSEPAPIYELAMLALDSPESGWTEADGPKEDLAKYIVDFLTTKAEMLQDYFSLEISEDGNLCTLPMLLDKYVPAMEGLPLYILRLATEVDWESEQECFETFCRETAEFYTLKKEWATEPQVEAQEKEAESDEKKGKSADQHSGWRWVTEHVLYPAIKSTLQPPRICKEDASLLQIANLPDLYKVFERC